MALKITPASQSRADTQVNAGKSLPSLAFFIAPSPGSPCLDKFDPSVADMSVQCSLQKCNVKLACLIHYWLNVVFRIKQGCCPRRQSLALRSFGSQLHVTNSSNAIGKFLQSFHENRTCSTSLASYGIGWTLCKLHYVHSTKLYASNLHCILHVMYITCIVSWILKTFVTAQFIKQCLCSSFEFST